MIEAGDGRTAEIDRILHATPDWAVTIDGKPVPVLTTLLYRICDGDQRKFEEALRIVELFIAEALKAREDKP